MLPPAWQCSAVCETPHSPPNLLAATIFVDGTKSSEQNIYFDMQTAAKRRGHIHVSITADEKAPYGIIIRILDAAKVTGLDAESAACRAEDVIALP